MTWLYEGREATDADLEGSVAFVYEILHKASGKRYIGKKRLFVKKTRKPLKEKKRKRVSFVESDWRDYWGSSDKLLEDVKKYGEQAFTRTILRLCKTLAESSYYEAKAQFENDALLHPDKYWNDWISVRVRTSHLRHLQK